MFSADHWPTTLALLATATACAALSPLIVARRWAFVGEGVGHSSFGGAGLIWIAATLLPGIEWLRTPSAVMLGAAVAALGAALFIGRIAQGRSGERLGFDAAVGIVLVGSLAFGFLARVVFERTFGASPVAADALLFGASLGVGPAEAIVGVAVAVAVVGSLVLFSREVLAYALDPELSALNGVRVGLVHYGLLVAIAATVAAGARLVGAVLVTALLVLPGATAAVVGRRVGQLWVLSAIVAISSVLIAAAVTAISRGTTVSALPAGPIVVLALVIEFLAASVVARLRR